MKENPTRHLMTPSTFSVYLFFASSKEDSAPVWCCPLVNQFECTPWFQIRAATWRVILSVRFLRRMFLAIVCNHKSSTKPVMHYISQRRQKRNQVRPCTECTENWAWTCGSRDTCADRQTYRQGHVKCLQNA